MSSVDLQNKIALSGDKESEVNCYMMGCAAIVGAVFGLFVGVIAWFIFDSVLLGIITFVIVSIMALGYLAEGIAIGNMATQDKRDEAILSELRKINKDE